MQRIHQVQLAELSILELHAYVTNKQTGGRMERRTNGRVATQWDLLFACMVSYVSCDANCICRVDTRNTSCHFFQHFQSAGWKFQQIMVTSSSPSLGKSLLRKVNFT